MKTLIFINLRFSDFYSKTLFKRIKETQAVRLVVIIDQQFKEKIGPHIRPYLDEVIYLQAQAKNGFLAEFHYKDLQKIVEHERGKASEISIICSDEFNLLNAGRLRREFHLSGHTDKNLLFYRDKIKMKLLLATEGLRVPKFKLLKPNDYFENIANEIGLPFVIKPVDSCGSYGVQIVRTRDEFQQPNHFLLLEAEEYIEGKLYHVDSCIRENQLRFICASEYTWPNHEYTKGLPLGSIPLDEHNPLSIRLIEFAKKCLKALKTNNLVNHMELFVTNKNEIVFLEISGRPPGALLNLTHYLNFGINLMDEDFFMQSGIEMDLAYDAFHEHAFFALFPLRAGKIVKLNYPIVKSRMDIIWHVSLNEVITQKECEHIVGKSAQAIFYHPDKKILREDFENIKHHQAIEVV